MYKFNIKAKKFVWWSNSSNNNDFFLITFRYDMTTKSNYFITVHKINDITVNGGDFKGIDVAVVSLNGFMSFGL